MSSRRKKAPPVRVDEEDKKRLNWNMLDDRKNEEIPEDDQIPTCSVLPADPAPSSSFLSTIEDVADAACTSSLRVTEELPSTSSDSTSTSASLALAVEPVLKAGHIWKALIGEFSVRPSWIPSDCEQRAFVLHRMGEQLCLSYSSCDESSGLQWKPDGDTCTAECSLSAIPLEDLDWMQKRRVVQLCHQTKEGSVKVGIYVVETGLGKPEFLSEGNARLKKANQLMQKLMEYFYDFIIPEVVENEEEECDTDLERQNVEELYDYVRHLHQSESREVTFDVQHKALIPVLRPYQSQAVNWMLWREKSRNTSPREQTLHFLWRELITLCGKKLFYNPFTGCLIREFPLAGVEWPGGILADEMGLGKTVEVLALILFHTRQDLKHEALTLPVGKFVNYFVPPPPLERKKVISCKSEVQPKMKISYPTVRVMLLTAIKEMRSGKGASVNAIFTYIRATYGYDLLKNRTHIRKTLVKLIDEGLVDRVKGRGLAGSFKLGKNYKETKKLLAGASKFNSKNTESTPRKTFQRRAKEKAEAALQNSFTDDQMDLYSPTSDCLAPERAETKKDWDESLNGKADQSVDMLDAPTATSQIPQEKESDTQDVLGMDDLPEETREAPQLQTETPTRASIVPFNTPDYRFECICGELGIVDYKARVQCMNCQLWQHADCVNYKQESLETTPFYCPHCLVAMKPVSTGATLIISPSSICHQWVEEINRHIRSSSLRVLVYQGVKKHGFIQPHVLAEQDVVITTYDVLRSELNYVDIPHSNSKDGRRFRNQKRYMAIPSPLVAVEWWRICLDEAQMVECPTAKAAEMALRLASVNRWCVSGTPVQRGLEDLYGLVLFLGVDPYWVKHWWDQLLYRPYRRGNTEPLYYVIAQLLWRSAKKDVIDQIQIPPQTEEVHWLHFSPVEGHFYHRQHEVCSQDALVKLRKISDWSLKLGSLDRRTVNTILCPLLRLRQACCHPQAVRGEFLPLQKSTMTMEELLKSLQKKCRVECEEAHRQLVCALNGLAGIHIIRDEFVEAVEMYREVLRSSEEHKGRLKTDSLQAEQLRQHYMTKYDSEVADAHQSLQPVLQNIKELKRKVNLNSPWWLDVIQRSIRCSTDDDLVSRVKNELTSSYKQQAHKLSMADNCVFCKADELFTDYESKLFSHTVKGQTAIFEEMIEDEEGLVDDRLPTTSRGLWAASETERTLKAILSFAKVKRMDPELVEESNTFMELFENWKKEYKVLHEYWMVLRNHVSAIDELGMATERLRVEQNRVKLLNDQAVAKSQLQKKLGQFLYLTNLEKWAVLTCGHCFCNECIAIIVEQYSVGSRRRAIKCAICRQTTSHTEISYVFTTQSSSQDQDIPVKWLSVLDIIAKALFDNNMEFSQINGIHKFQENLSSFKYEEKINILLLPLHTGSNGLNIIEATHVLLVEPILNPAHELQAIGRVHRIGQTKPTFVHRFLIKSTIEERMQAMLKTAEKSHTSTAMKHSEAAVLTVADLADLFTEDTEHLE
ncbi:E3 ubiquitin-protein ligase SHPRH [Collichthys lucidus]|uniref:E3 ubiquitin-protein ligase SHPRH n=1 Tax=Collichthys lucidus TaxID=240159 RepID=A0A4U5VFZ5_COLLU|nr:E3 ubiquitin-protein ligase SHPRH [Collichthys lucidus]